tara:strand:+ start:1421 stop:2284 length:864 start_codon:yes stop_codon:yes gene_type:complete
MQKLAGLITESEYKKLFENENNPTHKSKVDWYYINDNSDYPGPKGRTVPNAEGFDNPKKFKDTELYIKKGTKGYISNGTFKDEEGNDVEYKAKYFEKLNESLNENALRTKIKELVHSSLGEAKKKKKDVAPQDDSVELDMGADTVEPSTDAPAEIPTDTITPDAAVEADIDPKIKSIQDSLQKAFANAKQLGDEKLMQQIGNTITMLVRTQVLGGQAVAESLNEDDIFNGSYSVSDEIYKRMDNLVSQPDYMDFIDSATKIMNNLVNEGFEVKDVFYYLYTRLLTDV